MVGDVLGWVGRLSDTLGALGGGGGRLLAVGLVYSGLVVWMLVHLTWLAPPRPPPGVLEAFFWSLDIVHPVLVLGSNHFLLTRGRGRLWSVAKLSSPPAPDGLVARLGLLGLLLRLPRFVYFAAQLGIPFLLALFAQLTVNFLVLSQFCGFLVLLSGRLRSLSLLPLSPANLVPCLRLHSSLRRASRTLTELYSLQLFFVAAMIFRKFVLYAHVVVTLLDASPIPAYKLYDGLSVLAFCSLQVLLLFYACDYTKAQDKKFRTCLFEYASRNTNPGGKKLFFYIASLRDLNFEIKGFFKMEVQELLPVLGTVTTLVIILSQTEFEHILDV